MQIDTSRNFVDFIDNIWNFTSEQSLLSPNGLQGYGGINLYDNEYFYACVAGSSMPGNDLSLKYPGTVSEN